MQVHDEALPHPIQHETKFRAFSVSTIRPHPAESQAVLPCMSNNFKGKLIPGAEGSLIFRNPGFITTLRIFRPFFGQVQPNIYRHRQPFVGQHSKHRHLTIVNLAKSLPSNGSFFRVGFMRVFIATS